MVPSSRNAPTSWHIAIPHPSFCICMQMQKSTFPSGKGIAASPLEGGVFIRNIRKMVLSALLTALTVVCAWISVPVPPVSVTLQTFAVFLSLLVLGGKWGTVSIGMYLLLGFLGLPVFAGFGSGVSVLLGPSGGFLWGFFAAGITFWALERLKAAAAMMVSLAVCYLCGCLWFSAWAGGAGFAGAVMTCVVPYLVPDGVKLWLAWKVSKRLRKSVRI